MDPELEAFTTQTMLEVERDLFLPANSLVDATPLPEMKEKVTLKMLEARLDPQFLATVPAKHLQHSKELRLRKKVTQQEKTISLLSGVATEQQRATRRPYGCVSQTVKKPPIKQPTALLRATK